MTITAMGNTFSCPSVHCVLSTRSTVPYVTDPLFSCFQALRARLLSFGPSGTGYTLSL